MRYKGDEKPKSKWERKPCLCCGREFTAKRSWSKFCTADCKINHFRGRKSKWQRALGAKAQ